MHSEMNQIELKHLSSHSSDGTAIRAVSFIQGRQQVLTGHSNGTIRYWSIPDFKQLKSRKLHSMAITDIEVSRTESWLASVSQEATVLTLNLRRQGKTPIPFRLKKGANAVCISSDERSLFVGMLDGTIQKRAIDGNEIFFDLPAHSSAITGIRESTQFETLVTISGNGSIRTWDSLDGIPRRVSSLTDDEWNCIALEDTTNLLATGSADGRIAIWNISSLESIGILTGHKGAITCLKFHPRASVLLSCDSQGYLRLWNFTDLSLLEEVRVCDRSINDIDIGSGNNLIIFGCEDGTIHLYQASTSDALLLGHMPIKVKSDGDIKQPQTPSGGIEVFRGVGVEGDEFVYKVKIQNQSKFVVSNIAISIIRYPIDVVTLSDSPVQHITSLGVGSQVFQTVTFRFHISSERCIGSDIHAMVSWFDHEDNQHTQNVAPVKIRSICDLLVRTEIPIEEMVERFRSWQKTEIKIPLEICPTESIQEEIARSLKAKNFQIIDASITESEMRTIAYAISKYTQSQVGALITIPKEKSEECQASISVGSTDSALIGALSRELEDVLDRVLDAKLSPFIKRLDQITDQTIDLMHNAGVTRFRQKKMEILLKRLAIRSDKDSQMALHLIGQVLSVVSTLSNELQVTKESVQRLISRMDVIASRMKLEPEKKSRLKSILEKTSDKITSIGVEKALWWAVRAGLLALGIPP